MGFLWGFYFGQRLGNLYSHDSTLNLFPVACSIEDPASSWGHLIPKPSHRMKPSQVHQLSDHPARAEALHSFGAMWYPQFAHRHPGCGVFLLDSNKPSNIWERFSFTRWKNFPQECGLCQQNGCKDRLRYSRLLPLNFDCIPVHA